MENRLVLANGRWVVEDGLGLGISRSKPLYIENG